MGRRVDLVDMDLRIEGLQELLNTLMGMVPSNAEEPTRMEQKMGMVPSNAEEPTRMEQKIRKLEDKVSCFV